MQSLDKKKFLKFNDTIFILLVFIIIGLAFSLTIKNDWHISTHGSMHVWFAKNIAATISSMEHDLGGYVGFNKILHFFLNYPTINDDILNQALELQDVDSDGIFTMVELDIGYQDYSRVAFSLFGYSISSLLYLYFIILIISVGLYYFTFRENNVAKVILLIFLLSFLLLVPAAGRLGPNVAVIYSCRFMTILAILPLIHICLSALNSKTNITSRVFFQSLL